jgi:hypothetical protein
LSELFDLLEQREEDVRSLLSGVPGFVSYAALRTVGGAATVTVCHDKQGTDESLRRGPWALFTAVPGRAGGGPLP